MKLADAEYHLAHATTRMSSGFLCVPALLLLINVCGTGATVDNIVITRAPRSQVVLLSENATFYCSGTADRVSWVIENNGTHLDTLSEDEERRRGIVRGGFYMPRPQFNNTLTILGTEENNRTMIHCAFSTTSGRNDTPTATLTVWGPPAPPHPTLELLNATTLQLSWYPPFTWTEFPIQNYTVRMGNLTNSMNNRQDNIPIHENNSNDTSVTFELSAINGEIARGCALLDFSVTAWSDLGESRPGRFSGGFPIVPQIDSENVLMIITSFQSNLSPLINIRFQAPRVCPFQTANYTILMDRVGTNQTITIGPTPYYYRPSSTIEIWVNSSLVANEEYSITAVFSSLAGSVSLPNVTVCTDFRPPTTVTPTTTTTDTSHPPTQSLAIPVIVGAAVGAVAVLVLMVMLIMCAIVCLYCFRISRKRSKPAATLTTYQGAPPTPMSLNPLYEGSGTDESLEHYENLDPYLVDERHVTGPMLCPPMIPPPRNGMDANAWLPSGKSLEQLSTSNEQYTVMTSAGTLADPQITDGQITYALPNDAERYVINDPK